jgi:hypothetical protein
MTLKHRFAMEQYANISMTYGDVNIQALRYFAIREPKYYIFLYGSLDSL